MFRRWGSAAVALMFVASNTVAFAGTSTQSNTQSASILAPGKAAGVQKAMDMGTNTGLMLVGGAVVVGGLVLVLSGNGGHSHAAATTTTGVP